jgi:hypothetical protein
VGGRGLPAPKTHGKYKKPVRRGVKHGRDVSNMRRCIFTDLRTDFNCSLFIVRCSLFIIHSPFSTLRSPLSTLHSPFSEGGAVGWRRRAAVRYGRGCLSLFEPPPAPSKGGELPPRVDAREGEKNTPPSQAFWGNYSPPLEGAGGGLRGSKPPSPRRGSH